MMPQSNEVFITLMETDMEKIVLFDFLGRSRQTSIYSGPDTDQRNHLTEVQPAEQMSLLGSLPGAWVTSKAHPSMGDHLEKLQSYSSLPNLPAAPRSPYHSACYCWYSLRGGAFCICGFLVFLSLVNFLNPLYSPAS